MKEMVPGRESETGENEPGIPGTPDESNSVYGIFLLLNKMKVGERVIQDFTLVRSSVESMKNVIY